MLSSRTHFTNDLPGRLCLLAVALFSGFAYGASFHSMPHSTSSQGAQSHDPAVLNLGANLERDLSPGEKHSYQVTLAQGQYARVVAEQRGIDLVLRCFGIDGKIVAETDLESRLNGEEKLELVADQQGVYKIEVESRYKVFPAGRYSLRLVDVRSATEADRLLQEARKLSREASSAISAGNYDEAQSMLDKVRDIRERILGPAHPDLGYSLALMANVAYYKAEYAKAETLYRTAISLLEKSLGAGHPYVATYLNNLASLYQVKGDESRSVEIHKRALEIREKSLIADHPDIAQSLNNLANVYFSLGDYELAEPLFLRAIGINEKVLGPDHLNLSYPLVNLGYLYTDRGEYEKAEPLLRRALAIREQKLPNDHPAVALALFNLARVIYWKNDYQNAEALFRRALTIYEKKLGPEHPATGRCLNNLADIYMVQKRYDEAEPLYRRAMTIKENSLGPDHPDTFNSLNSLAWLYMAKGDYKQAVDCQARAIAAMERNLILNLATGSERQKLAYLANLPVKWDRALFLHMNFAPEDASARDLAVTSVLNRKGRVLDAMSDSLATLRNRFGPGDQLVLDQLNEVTARLARLVLNGPQRTTLAEHQQEIGVLQKQREQLEGEVSRLSAGFYEHPRPIALSTIQAAIPDNAALVEFAIVRPFDDKPAIRQRFSEPHYVAYVIRNRGDVLWKDLGATKQIDETIDAFRRALRSPKERDIQTVARTADDEILRPLRSLLGDATHLLISAEGSLNLIPFEALVDEHRRYVIERYSFSYLTSGRDLLRMQIARASKEPPIVFADPLFGVPRDQRAAIATVRTGRTRPAAKSQSVTTGRDLSSIYFAPLAGTAEEARSIKALFPGTTVLTGRDATETALKRVEAPRILHIATHGFFLQDAAAAVSQATSAMAPNTRAVYATVRTDNPLLRSGLALAGANISASSDDDGIITALEASNLNLWGTKLVTLSACDTGIGEVRNGEGVYGLRRAFVLAGAETLVMSLWPVSDFVTREIMTAYYEGLRAGLGRGEALRQVKLKMLTSKDQSHPYYWASFIQSGEWANLDGKR
jgi:CHAT domain-containing protein/Tfp pilus assembly protein PilF